MRRNRSYLHLLDIFEVAARHGSFKNAAEELNISPSAVSHQIRSLESKLGFSLFNRKPGQVIVSKAGYKLLQKISPVFQQIDTMDLEQLTQRQAKIHLMVNEDFSIELKQQIEQKLKQLNWQGELILEEIVSVEQLESDDFNLAIRIGSGHWPGFKAIQLCHVVTLMVASNQYIKDHKIKGLDDLKGHKILYNETHKRFAHLLSVSVESMGGSENQQFYSDFKVLIEDLLAGEGYSGLFLHFAYHHLTKGKLTPIKNSARHWREKIYLIYQEDKVLDEFELAIIDLFKEDYHLAEKFSLES